jgi:putative transcriptional regulator
LQPDPELIFGADIGAKYDRAMQKIGIRPGMLSATSGHA